MKNEDTIQQLPAMLDLWQTTLQWQPSDRQISQFQKLYEAIIIGNRKHNLTRITTPEDFWEKHLWDSLMGVMLLKKEEKLRQKDSALKVIDIGTGAGSILVIFSIFSDFRFCILF